MVRGNKGEWSEYYAFLKILVDQKLFYGGPNFSKESGSYPVTAVIRDEIEGLKSYKLLPTGEILFSFEGKETKIIFPDLQQQVVDLFSKIISSKGRSFAIDSATGIMEKLHNSKLGAGNEVKEDLILRIQDPAAGSDPEIGFSIKSLVGGPATLLNASGATNFIYQVKGISKDKIGVINSIEGKSKIQDRLMKVFELGGDIEFVDTQSSIFKKNLQKCDSILPFVIARMLQYYFLGKGRSMDDLIENILEDNVTFFDTKLDKIDYEHKLKNLLLAVALGMVPNREWDGNMRAYGGYIIVKSDGEVIGYNNAYNQDVFRKYLLKSTKFETGSSKRHKFGKVYEEDGKMFIKFNLQVRFTK